MERFVKCLKEIKNRKVDFFLNTGDSIMAVDRENSTRQEVYDQWNAWDNCMKEIADYDMYSCVGNHDIWWAGEKSDEMHGVPYAAKRLKMPKRYYSAKKEKWHFIMLDGNNSGITLDPEQMNWLKQQLENIPQGEYALIMSHYPILTVTGSWEGGQHKDHNALKDLFYKHKDKVKGCLSGHQHLLDRAWYNDVYYFCNGAMSGFWWGGRRQAFRETFLLSGNTTGICYIKIL
ncbi:metallophosphoesterase family protein [Chryseobacterium proteolyticum]|uniref:metallophosphoesterase family protein n=1 Tax=Chryseobacterium proteolyticum TaxID=118127 RepID=UPI0039830C55